MNKVTIDQDAFTLGTISKVLSRQVTCDLRWRGGVLEQAEVVTEYEGGNPVDSRVEWSAVPTVEPEA